MEAHKRNGLMTRSLTRVVILSLVILLTTTTVHADTDEPTLFGAIFSYVDAETKDVTTRLDAAENLLVATRAFSSEFPTLSPKELDYVEREMSEGSSDRLNRVINSDEYAIYEMRQAVDNVERTLEDIIKRGEAADSTRLKEWALVAFYLHDVDSSLYNRLLNKGIVEEHSFPITANSTAQWILSHAVIQFPN